MKEIVNKEIGNISNKIENYGTHSKLAYSYLNGITKPELYEAIKEKGFAVCEYTGKEIKLGDNFQYDHIISVKEATTFKNAEKLPPEVFAKVISDKNNVAVIDGSLNQSKQDDTFKEWMNRKSSGRDLTNAEYFKVDKDKVLAKEQNAKEFIQNSINKYVKENGLD